MGPPAMPRAPFLALAGLRLPPDARFLPFPAVAAVLAFALGAADSAAVHAQGVCNRTQQVRDVITTSAGVACADVTAAHLAAVVDMKIPGKGVRSLKLGDFQGLTGLTGLSLGWNNRAGLTSLPAGLLDELSNALITLNLAGIQLSDDDVADVLRLGGADMDLRATGLTATQVDKLLDGLRILDSLSLDGNDLAGVTWSKLSKFTDLDKLSLNGANLNDEAAAAVTANARPGLEVLRMSYNSLTEVPSLSRLTGLNTLTLQFNDLDEADLTSSAFAGPASLSIVELWPGNPGITRTAAQLTSALPPSFRDATETSRPGVNVNKTVQGTPLDSSRVYDLRLHCLKTGDTSSDPRVLPFTRRAGQTTPSVPVHAPGLRVAFVALGGSAHWRLVDTVDCTATEPDSGAARPVVTYNRRTLRDNLGMRAFVNNVYEPSYSIAPSVAADEGQNAELAIQLGQAAPSGGLTLNVAYDYSGSAATEDDTGSTSATLEVPQNSATATLSIPIAADNLVEGEETFTVTISTSEAGWSARSGGAVEATVTINDADLTAARVAFGSDAAATAKYTASAEENVVGGTLSVPVTVSRLPQSSTDFAVEVVTGGTATENTDYRIATKSVTFGPTDTSRTKNLTVTFLSDAVVEASETIQLRIAAADDPLDDLGDHYVRDALASTATITITPPVPRTLKLTTSAASDTATEAAGNVTVTATLDHPALTGGVSVTLSAGAASTATAADDYTLPGAFTISSSATSATASVTIVNDELVEDSENLVLTTTVSGLTVTGVTLTITDNENDAKIAFGSSAAATAKYTATVAENVASGTLNVPVTVSHLPGSSTTFDVQVLGTGTATENTDYSIGTKSVTFGPTDSNKTKNVAITITNDEDVEDDETVELRIAAATIPPTTWATATPGTPAARPRRSRSTARTCPRRRSRRI